MVVDRDGLPWDRASEEGAKERVQRLHPRDDNRLENDDRCSSVLKYRTCKSTAGAWEVPCRDASRRIRYDTK
jgi:hypothetical protein